MYDAYNGSSTLFYPIVKYTYLLYVQYHTYQTRDWFNGYISGEPGLPGSLKGNWCKIL